MLPSHTRIFADMIQIVCCSYGKHRWVLNC